MRTIVITAALALAVAVPASASDQLARSLGLEPGEFTTAELATIKGLTDAGDSTDRKEASVYQSLLANGLVSTQSVAGAGDAQLAANLGLDADRYSTAELATIKGLVEQRSTDDSFAISDLVRQGSEGVVSTQSVGSSAAKEQLAAFLGVDPEGNNLAELAAMKGDFEG
jgi:hypothetical protein